ncbi:hypothetical protein QUA40_23660 [Microcoleus sp. Pol11C3]|uniref:hypothetical protein n=1 Tax=Microcoleus sp. Pol11C3 TaxID=3055390 RepID=UPI002FD44656
MQLLAESFSKRRYEDYCSRARGHNHILDRISSDRTFGIERSIALYDFFTGEG